MDVYLLIIVFLYLKCLEFIQITYKIGPPKPPLLWGFQRSDRWMYSPVARSRKYSRRSVS